MDRQTDGGHFVLISCSFLLSLSNWWWPLVVWPVKIECKWVVLTWMHKAGHKIDPPPPPPPTLLPPPPTTWSGSNLLNGNDEMAMINLISRIFNQLFGHQMTPVGCLVSSEFRPICYQFLVGSSTNYPIIFQATFGQYLPRIPPISDGCSRTFPVQGNRPPPPAEPPPH